MALHPILAMTLQSAVMGVLSNVLAQVIASTRANEPLSINWIPVFQFVLFAVISTPPNVIWQEFLENTFPAHPPQPHPKKSDEPQPAPKLSVRNTAIKFLLDQTVGATANTLMFSTFNGSLQAAMSTAPRITDIRKAIDYWTSPGAIDFTRVDFAGVWEEAKADFWPIVMAGWKLWPAVSLFNFTVIKTVEMRNFVGASAGVVWGIYMSMVAAK